MQNTEFKLPLLRTHNLVFNELPDETLVYDLDTNKAFCLNETARMVMNQCDGTTSVDEALETINRRLNAKMSADMIWLVVSQLKDANFIEKNYEIPIQTNQISRRKILNAAASLGIALPIITSLVAPKAVDAQSGSCVTTGATCNLDNNTQSNCCSSTERCYNSGGGIACRACLNNTQIGFCGSAIPDCCPTIAPSLQNLCCNTPINFFSGGSYTCRCP